jgi:hypothetical protein
MSRPAVEDGTVRVGDEDRPARRYANGVVEYRDATGRVWLANPARVFTPKAAS